MSGPIEMLLGLGIAMPEALLPKSGSDMTKWAVVACDQFTSQPDYWQKAKELTNGHMTALDIVLPEIYLDRAAELTPKINAKMNEYITRGALNAAHNGFVLIRRETSRGERLGLLALIDLEAYDYAPGSKALIRSTEGTIIERLPPRADIRRGASLEIPHIMLLIDDPGMTVMGRLAQSEGDMKKLYDFNLMLGGGRIRGYAVPHSMTDMLADAFSALASGTAQAEKYGVPVGEPPFLMAVGDGNHSLAAAKTIWEGKKRGLAAESLKTDPARFAMCEIVNLHDESLKFEPIHRAVFGVDPESLVNELSGWAKAGQHGARHEITAVYGGKRFPLVLERAPHTLAVGALQMFLDKYIREHKEAQIDYIHGESALAEICEKNAACGFILPPIPKNGFFASIAKNGPLPRKAFSMGEASDKRYYLEARKIR